MLGAHCSRFCLYDHETYIWGWQRWIAFQLLHALAQVHERGICHGDIKCENSLVTSWNWVYLADIASYKPTYLPADNPVSLLYEGWVCWVCTRTVLLQWQ
jgi:serine/threonine protein kinase